MFLSVKDIYKSLNFLVISICKDGRESARRVACVLSYSLFLLPKNLSDNKTFTKHNKVFARLFQKVHENFCLAGENFKIGAPKILSVRAKKGIRSDSFFSQIHIFFYFLCEV